MISQGEVNMGMSSKDNVEYKTLLLCKVTGDDAYKNVYRDLCDKKYMTLGGFDALCVYPTCDSNKELWLKKVLEGRRDAVEKSTKDASYHPVHLVRYHRNVPKTEKQGVFLFAIFAYGVEDTFDDHVISNLNNAEIYECINICDRIILYYTNNIGDAMVKIDKIEEVKQAKKIYTTVNIPLDSQGAISEDTSSLLEKQSCELMDGECKYGDLSVIVRGSIKKPKLWQKTRLEIAELFRQVPYYSNYGEDDFVINSVVSGVDLLRLMNYFMNNSNQISNSCWDIHTEFQICKSICSAEDRDSSDVLSISSSSPHKPTSPLDIDYNEFVTIFEAVENKEAWMYAYKELLNVHRNLDQHPLLSGPAYMLYDGLKIIVLYLKAHFLEMRDEVSDVSEEAIRKVVPESQENLERFIRCWSQLTDQLTRNDDVVFHGIGRIPAIAATLPENLLEFYHGFLRKIAEALEEIDRNSGYIVGSEQNSFQYGFLLSPELNQRVRVSELFAFDYELQGAQQERAWPNKQVYIIQLPSEYIFSPVDCFMALAHECFHKFGEVFRCRKNRLLYMAAYAAAYLATYIGWGEKKTLCDAICTSILEYCKEVRRREQPYMRKTQGWIGEALANVMSNDGWKELFIKMKKEGKDSDPRYLYYPETIRRLEWAREIFVEREDFAGDKFKSKVMHDCAYLFKECYADYVAIYILNITPEEYIVSQKKEFMVMQQKYDDSIKVAKRIATFCQRMAVVLATCKQHSSKTHAFNDFKQDHIKTQLEGVHIDIGDEDVVKFIQDSYSSLVDDTIQPKLIVKNIRVETCPNSALQQVIEYLKYVSDTIDNQMMTRNVCGKVDELRKYFRKYIREESMFDSEFKKIIDDNRNRIRNDYKRRDVTL